MWLLDLKACHCHFVMGSFVTLKFTIFIVQFAIKVYNFIFCQNYQLLHQSKFLYPLLQELLTSGIIVQTTINFLLNELLLYWIGLNFGTAWRICALFTPLTAPIKFSIQNIHPLSRCAALHCVQKCLHSPTEKFDIIKVISHYW